MTGKLDHLWNKSYAWIGRHEWLAIIILIGCTGLLLGAGLLAENYAYRTSCKKAGYSFEEKCFEEINGERQEKDFKDINEKLAGVK